MSVQRALVGREEPPRTEPGQKVRSVCTASQGVCWFQKGEGMGESLVDYVKGLLEGIGGRRKTLSMGDGNGTEIGAGCHCHRR